MKSDKSGKGVTLIELLIVISVLAILVSIVMTVAARIENQAKEKLTLSTFSVIEMALDEYRDKGPTHRFPEVNPTVVNILEERTEILYESLFSVADSRKIVEQISDSLVSNKWNPTNSWPEIYDPWQTPIDYQYRYGIDTYPILRSYGPDRTFNTGDDIVNK